MCPYFVACFLVTFLVKQSSEDERAGCFTLVVLCGRPCSHGVFSSWCLV